jgi:sec-independent protein translocase protein TatA
MLANGFQGWHLLILVALLVLLFGAKRLPDAARSLGKSMRIFKSEIKEMKSEPEPESDVRPTAIASERVDPAPPAARHDVAGSPAPRHDVAGSPAPAAEQSADKHPA